MQEILRLIKPFQSLPQLRELETIIGKVQGTISQNTGDQIIVLDHNPNVKGLNLIETLYPLIKEEKIVSIKYKPFSREEEIEYLLHPFLIKEYNNRWFLIGWLPAKNKYTVLGIDRIVQITEQAGKIDKTKKNELVLLQKSILGVSFTEGVLPTEIKLWITLEQLPYILTKPLHPSQKLIEEHSDGSIITLNLVPNYELEQLLLSFGEKIKVLEPELLQIRIQKRLKDAIALY